KVGKLVMASANIRRDAIPAEMLAQQAQVSSAAIEFMKDTPMYQLYQRVAPRPEDFGRLLDKIGESMSKDFDFSQEMRSLQVPTMLVCADADMAPPRHYVEAFKLLDGGLRDGGWMGEGRPKGGHALAVLPGLDRPGRKHRSARPPVGVVVAERPARERDLVTPADRRRVVGRQHGLAPAGGAHPPRGGLTDPALPGKAELRSRGGHRGLASTLGSRAALPSRYIRTIVERRRLIVRGRSRTTRPRSCQ